MKNRIFFKMLAVFVIVIGVTAVLFDVMLGRAWEASLRSQIERDLTQKTLLFAHRVGTDKTHSLSEIAAQEGQAAGARATIIDANGNVLADSEAVPSSMENHANRAEFAAALSGKTGSNERRSATLGIPFLYVAAPISGGAVRLAYPLSEIDAVQTEVRRRLLWGSLVAFLIALLIAASWSVWTARRLERIVDVAAHIERGDLRARVNAAPLDEIGRVAAAIDKTAGQIERSFAAVRSSQRQLETLLNSMQDAVIAISADGLVRWANQPMDQLVPQRTRLNAPVVETIRDPDFLATVKAATSSKEVRTARATSIVPGRAFDVTAAPLPEGGVVAVLRDLTETERVEKTRRDFIANVSHELRTPLTSIRALTEILLDDPEIEQRKKFLGIITKESERLTRLINQVLDLSKIESGKAEWQATNVDMTAVISDTVAAMSQVFQERHIEVKVKAPDRVSPVAVDVDRIIQVMLNLLSNAAKFCESGKGRIEIALSEQARNLRVDVRDNGPGIDPKDQAIIFDKFRQVGDTLTDKPHGSGLGLHISRRIVEHFGGRLWVESSRGRGACFSFTLPTGAGA